MAGLEKITESLAEHRLNKWYYDRWQRDNKVEAPKVIAYLDGGPRPSDAEVPTHYGKGLLLAEDARRELDAGSGGYPVPPAIAGQGYAITFQDEFNSIDTTKWSLGRYYLGPAPSFFSVANSVITIRSGPAPGYSTHDLESKRADFLYGYYECRMRYTRAPAAFSAWWALPAQYAYAGWNCSNVNMRCGEIDFYEAFHEEELVMDSGVPSNKGVVDYRLSTGTLHFNTANNCGVADTANYGNYRKRDSGFVLADNWRTYATLWTPETIYWYIDDVLQRTWPTYANSTNQPQRLYVTSHGHSGRPGPAEIVTDVDFVRVWQK